MFDGGEEGGGREERRGKEEKEGRWADVFVCGVVGGGAMRELASIEWGGPKGQVQRIEQGQGQKEERNSWRRSHTTP